MRRDLNSFVCMTICRLGLVLLTSVANAQSEDLSLQPGGEYGSGDPLFVYYPTTGDIAFDANGGEGIGLFQVKSTRGIFTGDGIICPGDCLLPSTEYELNLAGATPLPLRHFNDIAARGLSEQFLLDDLITAFVNRGFGQPFRALHLLCVDCLEVDNIPPVAVNPTIAVLPGERADRALVATDNYAPQSELRWSDLVFLGGPGAPALNASISDFGRFEWRAQGSVLGEYSWQATVGDAVGNQGPALILVRVVPEPASALMIILSFLFFAGRLFRKGAN